MRLWTFHRDGFSIVNDRVNPRKSRFAESFPEQYTRLWERLHSDQFIWCVTDPDDWPIKEGYEEWKLEVPIDRFLAIVHDVVWNGLLGREGFPKRLYDQIEQELLLEEEKDCDVHDLVMKRIEAMRSPVGDPWDHLFIHDPFDPVATILLRCPVIEEWVLSRRSYDSPNRKR